VSALLVTIGDNPDRLRSEAAFAHLCGVAPIPASSGKTNRHRLHRGGDRSDNSALHIATIVRLRYDPRSRAYAERRTTEGCDDDAEVDQRQGLGCRRGFRPKLRVL
jgi:transposase